MAPDTPKRATAQGPIQHKPMKEAMVLRPDLGNGDPVVAFEAEIEEVVHCLEANADSPILSGELARDAIHLCHKQTESVRTRAAVKV